MVDVVENPAVPYTGTIPCGIFPNKTIYIQGLVQPSSERFDVNLQKDDNNIAFHFNPRFAGNNFVVCNTMTNGKWGKEERQSENVSFGRSQNFQMVILTEQDGFKVMVNGRHFADYQHRFTNLQEISQIRVRGGVQIYSIQFDPPSTGCYHGAKGLKVMQPTTPYHGPIGAGGLQYGTQISVKLTVNPNPNRFHINLTGGYYGPQQDDIAFHFNPRFPQGVIVRNTKTNGKWAGEERGGAFPFTPNGRHEVTILCLKRGYLVEVDGHHVVEYKHRYDAQKVKSMSVQGDVVVNDVSID